MRLKLSVIALLVGCSDYSVDAIGESKEGDTDSDVVPDTGEEEEGVPDLVADPEAVDLGIICGQGSRTVKLSNQGDGPLTISELVLTGSSWTMEAPSLPLVLELGEATEVVLTGVDGTGLLEVLSDDPDTPILELPLSIEVDVGPTVEILDPADGSVLAVGAVSSFQASVSDDKDALNELQVEWSSDVDGLVASVPADTDGLSSLSWDAGAVSSGAHTVTVTVTDTCGNVATDSITVCQNEGYEEESIDIATWNFEGAAQWDTSNGWVELTKAAMDQAGTAFQTSATVDASNVSIEFQFYVSGGSGADGMSLTALDSTRMTSFVGLAGGGIGYAGLPGWSIEIDTYYNGTNNDPTTNDHISVHIDGDQSTPVAWMSLPEMEDGAWHTMVVTVSGTWMTVEVDGTAYIDQDIAGLTAFPAYVGFTAATGSLTNKHLVDALLVEKFVCED